MSLDSRLIVVGRLSCREERLRRKVIDFGIAARPSPSRQCNSNAQTVDNETQHKTICDDHFMYEVAIDFKPADFHVFSSFRVACGGKTQSTGRLESHLSCCYSLCEWNMDK